MSSSRRVVNVGLIGCGEVAQTVHIPTLNHFNEYYRITYLCDTSEQALKQCESKVCGSARPKLTKNAVELCSSPDVDVVFVINANEDHMPHTVFALQHDKIAFVEKLMAMNHRDVELILDAERKSKGTVMVGYMRRYATAFIDAVKEIGTFPHRFSDYSHEDARELADSNADWYNQGLKEDLDIPVTEQSKTMWSLLGSLGSHDLSVMREALGMPKSVLGCSIDAETPFWNVLFQYPGFACSYESGINEVPRFDAHLEVYSRTKQITVQYDTPFIKGLPITMTIRENIDGGLQERIVRKTYEDS
ncbi:hypothetical protein LTS16_024248 [Friedmanniomyces endolithicus]|nr:hypothetical protein LTR75_015214 [Friedmanniomyces endolithicus]KAK0832573.1 hypothetical protein LTR03_015128 [Friedmanniomyces endolithicus]KAK0846628.1 hypothetical protein LTS02_014829 [Friedmanniomyces endolithicus]KAK0920028.1 hypothetical protein LTR57_010258 [Friedmanniomyces endolithicus]KAK0957502.1 hypothetical protein LTS01_022344 [Friedmanniomyces endolithicus]